MRYQVARQGLREGFRPSGGIVTRWMVAASALFLFTAWNANSALAKDDAEYPAEYNAQCKEKESTFYTILPHNPYKIDYAVRDAWCLHIEELVNNPPRRRGLVDLQKLAGLQEESTANDAKAAFYVGSDAVRTLYQESGSLYLMNDWTTWANNFDTELANETIGVFEKVLSNIDQEEDPIDKWPRSMFVNPFDLTSHAQIANLSFEISVDSILTSPYDPKLVAENNLLDSSNFKSLLVIQQNLENAIEAAGECSKYESPAEWRAPRRYASNQMKAECNLIYNAAVRLQDLESTRLKRVEHCLDKNESCASYADKEKDAELEAINTAINEINALTSQYGEKTPPALSSFLNLWDKQKGNFWQFD